MMAHLGLAVETVLNRSAFATHLISVDWLAKTTIYRAAAVVRRVEAKEIGRPRSAVDR